MSKPVCPINSSFSSFVGYGCCKCDISHALKMFVISFGRLPFRFWWSFSLSLSCPSHKERSRALENTMLGASDNRLRSWLIESERGPYCDCIPGRQYSHRDEYWGSLSTRGDCVNGRYACASEKLRENSEAFRGIVERWVWFGVKDVGLGNVTS